MLTGSTGFVGLNTLSALLEQGHDVHLYVRSSSSRKYIEKFDVEIHEGELDDLAQLKSVMSGLDAVIHTAGDTSCFERDYDKLYQVNVIGTRNVVDAALSTGIKRLVYTSTTSTLGSSKGNSKIEDEKSKLRGFRAKSPYGRTKLLAEEEILRAHEGGIEAIILNPAEIIGAYDHNFQWGRLVMAVFANQVPFLPPGGGSFCSAKDVANAHVAALTKGHSGERYILAGDNRDYLCMLEIISDKLGRNYDRPKKNYMLFYMFEWLKDKFYPLLGKEFMVEPYRVKIFSKHYFYDAQKAQKELGYQTMTLENMINDSINWYKKNGILP
jgi:dihydroflavonol-4-reductase